MFFVWNYSPENMEKLTRGTTWSDPRCHKKSIMDSAQGRQGACDYYVRPNTTRRREDREGIPRERLKKENP